MATPKKARTPEGVYCDAMAEKKGTKTALAMAKKVAPEGKFSHSRADRAWYQDPRNPNYIKPGSIRRLGTTEAALITTVVSLRAGTHPDFAGRKFSWGYIMIGLGLRSEVEAMNLHDRAGVAASGTRSGKGGRWFADDQRLYEGNHRGLGVEAPDRKALRALREDPEALKRYLAGANEYESVLPVIAGAKKAAARKRAPKKAAK